VGTGIVVGRMVKGPGFSVPDKRVSREHFRLSNVDEALHCYDLSSRFGTFVNGRNLGVSGSAVLQVGDLIACGQTELRVEAAEGGGADKPREAGSAVGAESPSEPRDAPAPGGEEDPFAALKEMYTEEMLTFKRSVHRDILERLNLVEAGGARIQDDLRIEMERTLDVLLRERRHEIPISVDIPGLRQMLLDDLVNYGPITPLLEDGSISEVMVNGAGAVFIERKGRLIETSCRFSDDAHVMMVIHRIVEPLGRRIDEASPMVDARLPDGSRVNAIIPPLAIDGPSLTIRKFSEDRLTEEDLLAFRSISAPMVEFLQEAVRVRRNILISGGTGSGKTTLLNILSRFIPLGERLVTIEDSAELQLNHRNLVRLESRPANLEGQGQVSIRDLVVNSLRMRPDRIIVGECRGAEAFDMLQAMNTGHDGSLTTIHANSPRDALLRLESMVMMAGFDLPVTAIREQVSSAIDVVVQQSRMVDGSRKIVCVTEVTGREGDIITTQDIFRFAETGFDHGEQRVVGEFRADGNVPHFIEQLRQRGDLRLDMSVFHAGGKA